MLLSFCIWLCASMKVFIVVSLVCQAALRNVEWLWRQLDCSTTESLWFCTCPYREGGSGEQVSLRRVMSLESGEGWQRSRKEEELMRKYCAACRREIQKPWWRRYGIKTGSEQEGSEAAEMCGEETRACGILTKEEKAMPMGLFRDDGRSQSNCVLRTTYPICF